MVRPGISPRADCIALRYKARSDWARGPPTAGPLRRLSKRDWSPAAAAARPIPPATASFPRTPPANGGITGYLAQSFKLVGQKQGAGARAGRSGRRFAAGMAAADHN